MGVVTYMNYCSQSPRPTTCTSFTSLAHLTIEYASVLSERMYALVAFARQDVIVERQMSVNESVRNQVQAIDVITRVYQQQALPTIEQIVAASGVVPTSLQQVGEATLARFPTSFCLRTFIEHATSASTSTSASASASTSTSTSSWRLDAIQELFPEWDECVTVLQHVSIQSTLWRRWMQQRKVRACMRREGCEVMHGAACNMCYVSSYVMFHATLCYTLPCVCLDV